MILRASRRCGEIGVLVLERHDLLEAAERHLDRRDEVALLERLHQVRERAGVAGLVDEIVLRERGQDQHGRQSLAGDRPRGGEPVHPRHLDVEDREIGVELAHEIDGVVAAAGLTDDLVILFFEDLLEVETDDRFVLGEHHPYPTPHRQRPGVGGARWTIRARPPSDRAARPARLRARAPTRRERISLAGSAHRRAGAPPGPRRRRPGSPTRANATARPRLRPRRTRHCSSATASSARNRLRRSLTSIRRRCSSGRGIESSSLRGSAGCGTVEP